LGVCDWQGCGWIDEGLGETGTSSGVV
jgi:hypothetical protein